MKSDPRDYQLDIRSADIEVPQLQSQRAEGKRPYLRVLFACCSVYQRVYRSSDGKRYDARCPKCGKLARFLVGEGGSDEREFVVE